MPATDPVVVVLQLTGGNDYLNTVVPYNNPLYRDNRKAVSIGDNQILRLDNDFGMPAYLAPMKQFWDEGNLAIMHGVGYLDSPRSHFRSMDIWHTCEADKVGTEGWLGRVIREIDPNKENVVTAVSFPTSQSLSQHTRMVIRVRNAGSHAIPNLAVSAIRRSGADSDEVARAFRDDVARYSDMMSPGSGASLADNFWHSVSGRSTSLWHGEAQQAASERAPIAP